MIISKTKRFYYIDDGNDIYKLPVGKTDRALCDIIESIEKIKILLKNIHAEAPETAKIIENKIFASLIDYNDGYSSTINTIIENTKSFSNRLKKAPKGILTKKKTLQSYGFTQRRHFSDNRIWHERIIEDNATQQIAEELVELSPNQIVRRLRLIIWKQDTPEGIKSSDVISYKNLRMTKQLRNAVLAEKGDKR